MQIFKSKAVFLCWKKKHWTAHWTFSNMVRKCSTTFNTETSKIHELKQEKVKATNKVIQAPCHFLWTKLTEVAAAVWAHLTHSCVRMWWNMYRMYILFLYLAVLSLLKGKPSVHPKVNIQQVLDMHQSSYEITVCPCFLHIHLHTHTPPLPIPPGSQQWVAALHSYRMGWAGAPAPCSLYIEIQRLAPGCLLT